MATEESTFLNRNLLPEDIEWNEFSDCTLIHESNISRLYRARKGGRYYMLKTLKCAGTAPSEEEIYLLKREFLLSDGIVHPNIADLYSFENESPVGPCIVMEYVDGCTLRDYLATNPDLRSRKRIFSQILDAVEAIHSHGVIHNDLKPENILVTSRCNDVRLIDFGFSVDDMQYLAENSGGTASYAAPELLEGGRVDARSDIFSIGRVMGDIFGDRYARIARKCTRKRQEDRYRDIAELRKAWKHFYTPLYAAVIIAALALASIPATRFLTDYKEMKTEHEKAARHEYVMDSLKTVAFAHIDKMCEEAEPRIKGSMCCGLAFQYKCRFTLDVCSYKKEFCENELSDEGDRVYLADIIDNYETQKSDRLMEIVNSLPELSELRGTLPKSVTDSLQSEIASFYIHK